MTDTGSDAESVSSSQCSPYSTTSEGSRVGKQYTFIKSSTPIVTVPNLSHTTKRLSSPRGKRYSESKQFDPFYAVSPLTHSDLEEVNSCGSDVCQDDVTILDGHRRYRKAKQHSTHSYDYTSEDEEERDITHGGKLMKHSATNGKLEFIRTSALKRNSGLDSSLENMKENSIERVGRKRYRSSTQTVTSNSVKRFHGNEDTDNSSEYDRYSYQRASIDRSPQRSIHTSSQDLHRETKKDDPSRSKSRYSDDESDSEHHFSRNRSFTRSSSRDSYDSRSNDMNDVPYYRGGSRRRSRSISKDRYEHRNPSPTRDLAYYIQRIQSHSRDRSGSRYSDQRSLSRERYEYSRSPEDYTERNERYRHYSDSPCSDYSVTSSPNVRSGRYRRYSESPNMKDSGERSRSRSRIRHESDSSRGSWKDTAQDYSRERRKGEIYEYNHDHKLLVHYRSKSKGCSSATTTSADSDDSRKYDDIDINRNRIKSYNKNIDDSRTISRDKRSQNTGKDQHCKSTSEWSRSVYIPGDQSRSSINRTVMVTGNQSGTSTNRTVVVTCNISRDRREGSVMSSCSSARSIKTSKSNSMGKAKTIDKKKITKKSISLRNKHTCKSNTKNAGKTFGNLYKKWKHRHELKNLLQLSYEEDNLVSRSCTSEYESPRSSYLQQLLRRRHEMKVRELTRKAETEEAGPFSGMGSRKRHRSETVSSSDTESLPSRRARCDSGDSSRSSSLSSKASSRSASREWNYTEVKPEKKIDKTKKGSKSKRDKVRIHTGKGIKVKAVSNSTKSKKVKVTTSKSKSSTSKKIEGSSSKSKSATPKKARGTSSKSMSATPRKNKLVEDTDAQERIETIISLPSSEFWTVTSDLDIVDTEEKPAGGVTAQNLISLRNPTSDSESNREVDDCDTVLMEKIQQYHDNFDQIQNAGKIKSFSILDMEKAEDSTAKAIKQEKLDVALKESSTDDTSNVPNDQKLKDDEDDIIVIDSSEDSDDDDDDTITENTVNTVETPTGALTKMLESGTSVESADVIDLCADESGIEVHNEVQKTDLRANSMDTQTDLKTKISEEENISEIERGKTSTPESSDIMVREIDVNDSRDEIPTEHLDSELTDCATKESKESTKESDEKCNIVSATEMSSVSDGDLHRGSDLKPTLENISSNVKTLKYLSEKKLIETSGKIVVRATGTSMINTGFDGRIDTPSDSHECHEDDTYTADEAASSIDEIREKGGESSGYNPSLFDELCVDALGINNGVHLHQEKHYVKPSVTAVQCRSEDSKAEDNVFIDLTQSPGSAEIGSIPSASVQSDGTSSDCNNCVMVQNVVGNNQMESITETDSNSRTRGGFTKEQISNFDNCSIDGGIVERRGRNAATDSRASLNDEELRSKKQTLLANEDNESINSRCEETIENTVSSDSDRVVFAHALSLHETHNVQINKEKGTSNFEDFGENGKVNALKCIEGDLQQELPTDDFASTSKDFSSFVNSENKSDDIMKLTNTVSCICEEKHEKCLTTLEETDVVVVENGQQAGVSNEMTTMGNGEITVEAQVQCLNGSMEGVTSSNTTQIIDEIFNWVGKQESRGTLAPSLCSYSSSESESDEDDTLEGDVSVQIDSFLGLSQEEYNSECTQTTDQENCRKDYSSTAVSTGDWTASESAVVPAGNTGDWTASESGDVLAITTGDWTANMTENVLAYTTGDWTASVSKNIPVIESYYQHQQAEPKSDIYSLENCSDEQTLDSRYGGQQPSRGREGQSKVVSIEVTSNLPSEKDCNNTSNDSKERKGSDFISESRDHGTIHSDNITELTISTSMDVNVIESHEKYQQLEPRSNSKDNSCNEQILGYALDLSLPRESDICDTLNNTLDRAVAEFYHEIGEPNKCMGTVNKEDCKKNQSVLSDTAVNLAASVSGDVNIIESDDQPNKSELKSENSDGLIGDQILESGFTGSHHQPVDSEHTEENTNKLIHTVEIESNLQPENEESDDAEIGISESTNSYINSKIGDNDNYLPVIHKECREDHSFPACTTVELTVGLSRSVNYNICQNNRIYSDISQNTCNDQAFESGGHPSCTTSTEDDTEIDSTEHILHEDSNLQTEIDCCDILNDTIGRAISDFYSEIGEPNKCIRTKYKEECRNSHPSTVDFTMFTANMYGNVNAVESQDKFENFASINSCEKQILDSDGTCREQPYENKDVITVGQTKMESDDITTNIGPTLPTENDSSHVQNGTSERAVMEYYSEIGEHIEESEQNEPSCDNGSLSNEQKEHEVALLHSCQKEHILENAEESSPRSRQQIQETPNHFLELKEQEHETIVLLIPKKKILTCKNDTQTTLKQMGQEYEESSSKHVNQTRARPISEEEEKGHILSSNEKTTNTQAQPMNEKMHQDLIVSKKQMEQPHEAVRQTNEPDMCMFESSEHFLEQGNQSYESTQSGQQICEQDEDTAENETYEVGFCAKSGENREIEEEIEQFYVDIASLGNSDSDKFVKTKDKKSETREEQDYQLSTSGVQFVDLTKRISCSEPEDLITLPEADSKIPFRANEVKNVSPTESVLQDEVMDNCNEHQNENTGPSTCIEDKGDVEIEDKLYCMPQMNEPNELCKSDHSYATKQNSVSTSMELSSETNLESPTHQGAGSSPDTADPSIASSCDIPLHIQRVLLERLDAAEQQFRQDHFLMVSITNFLISKDPTIKDNLEHCLKQCLDELCSATINSVQEFTDHVLTENNIHTERQQ